MIDQANLPCLLTYIFNSYPVVYNILWMFTVTCLPFYKYIHTAKDNYGYIDHSIPLA